MNINHILVGGYSAVSTRSGLCLSMINVGAVIMFQAEVDVYDIGYLYVIAKW